MVLVSTAENRKPYSIDAYTGKIVITPDKTFSTIFFTIAELTKSSQRNNIERAYQLESQFQSALPDFKLLTVSQHEKDFNYKKVIEAERVLRSIGFIPPIKQIETHPLKHSIKMAYGKHEFWNTSQELITKTKIISTWIDFLREVLTSKQELPFLHFLMVEKELENAYMINASLLFEEIVARLNDFTSINSIKNIVREISSLLLNQNKLLAAPFKQTPGDLSEQIGGLLSSNELYLSQFKTEAEGRLTLCNQIIEDSLSITEAPEIV
ncbi:MAG: hypothetical protein Q7U68_01145 [Candidatus Roizmanbacteria bacterium]|nr:hypothetical protein [Candidatus Roizmanbacteria bacterium]